MNGVSIHFVPASSIQHKPTGPRLSGEILDLFPQVLSPPSILSTVNSSVGHRISTLDPPYMLKRVDLHPIKLKLHEQNLSTLELGIIRASNSPCSSPLHMVLKHRAARGPVGTIQPLPVPLFHTDRKSYTFRTLWPI